MHEYFVVDGDARRCGGYTGKDVSVVYNYKYDGHPIFFSRRNRDLGAIPVHVGYVYVRWLSPLYLYTW